MEEINIKNIIIGKQYEECENYKNVIKIAKEKNININVVEAGQKVIIEDNLYFNILWPCSKNIVNQNIINNNSMVCKLVYNKFSMLFTGDIEEIAEKEILNKYINLNILKSTILKVAHHGSKTSSIQEFLNAVRPKIALIGVGEENKFGHPSNITINNLKLINTQIYRTDKMGEIIIKTNGKKNLLLIILDFVHNYIHLYNHL